MKPLHLSRKSEDDNFLVGSNYGGGVASTITWEQLAEALAESKSVAIEDDEFIARIHVYREAITVYYDKKA